MNPPQHDQEPSAALPPAPREPDLRRRGVFAVLASCGGTSAALAAWLLYGALYGAAVLVATFMLLVIVLMVSSVLAGRKHWARPGDAKELKS